MKTKVYNELAIEFLKEDIPEEVLFTGLASEVGEVLSERKIELLYDVNRDTLIKDELGDVLWFITAIAHQRGYTLKDLMVTNIAKLEDRLLNPKKVEE